MIVFILYSSPLINITQIEKTACATRLPKKEVAPGEKTSATSAKDST
ncbi:hypothetical protein [Thiolapillus sp.]|nr:hypothetical protein [Thiolapillus sp.]